MEHPQRTNTIREEDMKQEVIRTEDGWIIKIPSRQIQRLKDWKFTVLMEIALMMAKPEDFMNEDKQ